MGWLPFLILVVLWAALLIAAQPPDPPAELGLLRDLSGRSRLQKDSIVAGLSSILSAFVHLPQLKSGQDSYSSPWLLDAFADLGNSTVLDSHARLQSQQRSGQLRSHRLRLAALSATVLTKHGVLPSSELQRRVFSFLSTSSPVKPEPVTDAPLPWFRALQFHAAKLLTAPGLQSAADEGTWAQLWSSYDAQAAACVAPRAAALHSWESPFAAMIPNVLHTAKTDGVAEWYRPLQAVVATAAFQRMAPNRLLLHSDVVPTSKAWGTVAQFTSVRLAKVPKTITRHNGDVQPLKYPAHYSDVMRAKLLAQHGGVWMDWDVVPLKPHDSLRAALLPPNQQLALGLHPPAGSITPQMEGAQPSAVLAREKHVFDAGSVFYGYFGVAVMAAPRGSAFMQAWGEAQRSEYSFECYTCGSTVAVTRMLQARPDWAVELPWRTWYAPGWEAEAVQWLMQPVQNVTQTEVQARTADIHAVHLFFSHGSWNAFRDYDFLSVFSQPGTPSSVLHSLTQDLFQFVPSQLLIAANTQAVLFRSMLGSLFCEEHPRELELAVGAKAALLSAKAARSLAERKAAGDAIRAAKETMQAARTKDIVALSQHAGRVHAASGSGQAPGAEAEVSARSAFAPAALLRDKAYSKSGTSAAFDQAAAQAILGDETTSNAPDVEGILRHFVSPEDVLQTFAEHLVAGSAETWLCKEASETPSAALQRSTTAALTLLQAQLTIAATKDAVFQVGAGGDIAGAPEADVEHAALLTEVWILGEIYNTLDGVGVLSTL